MRSRPLLATLFKYKAWADDGMIAAVSALLRERGPAPLADVQAILNHLLIVDEIFIAHLQRRRPAHASVDAVELLEWDVLCDRLRRADQWYIDHVDRAGEAALSTPLAFAFTDGRRGAMTGEEMLAHVICHGGYHRGEAGRLLTQLTGASPRDTLTGYLHEIEPARRMAPA